MSFSSGSTDSFKRIAKGEGSGRDYFDAGAQLSFGTFGAQVVKGEDDKEAAKIAADESVAAAKKLADEQDQAFNKANQKKPNYMAIKSGNAGSYDDTLLAGRKGNGGLLGKNTLLGA